MTAADRPSVTDNARAEAWPEYVPLDLVNRVVEYLMICGTRDGLILANEVNTLLGASARRRAADRAETTTDNLGDAYMLGYAAAKNAETTTATDEDVTRVLAEHTQLPRDDGGAECECGGWRGPWSGQEHERHVAQALADAGLLATARTRPTREQIIDAIGHDGEWCKPERGPERCCDAPKIADAVLALLADQPDPADVWDQGYAAGKNDLRDGAPFRTFNPHLADGRAETTTDEVYEAGYKSGYHDGYPAGYGAARAETTTATDEDAAQLATARTRPTREQIASAIGNARWGDEWLGVPDAPLLRQADAVLALLNEEADQ